MRNKIYNKIRNFEPLNFLQKLDAVAEWVAELKAIVVGNRNSFQNIHAVFLQSPAPQFQILDQISNVCFSSCAVEIVLRSDVNLHLAEFKPKAAAILQRFGFWNLSGKA